MYLRKLPTELGQLVDSHRPLNPVLGWAIVAALSLPLAVMATFMAPGPLVGLAILAGFGARSPMPLPSGCSWSTGSTSTASCSAPSPG